jgi:modulator of FtsH protease
VNEFYVAAAGASAALAGLVIVALSVSVKQVINIPGMSTRSAASISLLVAATVISLASLVEQAPIWTGIEIVAAGIVTLIFAIDSMVRLAKVREEGMALWSALFRTGIAAVPALLFILGGVLVLLGIKGVGGVLALGTILAIVVAVINTWVVLIEIRR